MGEGEDTEAESNLCYPELQVALQQRVRWRLQEWLLPRLRFLQFEIGCAVDDLRRRRSLLPSVGEEELLPSLEEVMEINCIIQNMKDVVAAFKQEVIRRQLDVCLLEKRRCVRAVESEYFFEESRPAAPGALQRRLAAVEGIVLEGELLSQQMLRAMHARILQEQRQRDEWEAWVLRAEGAEGARTAPSGYEAGSSGGSEGESLVVEQDVDPRLSTSSYHTEIESAGEGEGEGGGREARARTRGTEQRTRRKRRARAATRAATAPAQPSPPSRSAAPARANARAPDPHRRRAAEPPRASRGPPTPLPSTTASSGGRSERPATAPSVHHRATSPAPPPPPPPAPRPARRLARQLALLLARRGAPQGPALRPAPHRPLGQCHHSCVHSCGATKPAEKLQTRRHAPLAVASAQQHFLRYASCVLQRHPLPRAPPAHPSRHQRQLEAAPSARAPAESLSQRQLRFRLHQVRRLFRPSPAPSPPPPPTEPRRQTEQSRAAPQPSAALPGHGHSRRRPARAQVGASQNNGCEEGGASTQ